MLLELVSLSAALSAPLPLSHTAPAEGLGWVELPALGATIGTLKGSPRRAWLWALPDEMVNALARAESGALDAWGKHPQDVSVRWGIEASSPPRSDVHRAWWKSFGFVEAPEGARTEGAVELVAGRTARGPGVLWYQGQQFGWANRPAAALSAVEVAPSPRRDAPTYAALVKQAPGAWVRGRIDVQRWYGLIAQSEVASQAAAVIDRLGLMRLRSVSLVATPSGAKVLGTLRLEVPQESQGLLGALAPAPSALSLGEWPANLLGIARANVRPAALYTVAAKVLNYLRPLVYSLFSAQVGAWERAQQKTLDAHLLGHTPRPWTLTAWREGVVLEVGVEDAEGLWSLFKALTGGTGGRRDLGSFQPVSKTLGSAWVARRGPAVYRHASGIWVGTSLAALRARAEHSLDVTPKGEAAGLLAARIDERAVCELLSGRRSPAGLGATTLRATHDGEALVVQAESSLQ